MTVLQEDGASQWAQEIAPGDVPGGPSTSQTIMVPSLQRLLAVVPPDASPAAYLDAVRRDNVLGKATAGGREWAFRQLRRFYALDPQSLLFRALRDLWTDDEAGQPLLAILCALARDPVLRASATVVFASEVATVVGPDDFDLAIEDAFPGAYKESTRRTAAQNVASSWAQSGHLHTEAVTRKVRSQARATPATLTYAVMLGHLQGARGQALFESFWARVLDQPKSQLSDLAVNASQRGLLEYRHAGGVVDISFNELLRPFDGEPERLL